MRKSWEALWSLVEVISSNEKAVGIDFAEKKVFTNEGATMSIIEVSDLMTSHPFTVRVEDSLQEVYDLMDEHGIRHVPVVSADMEIEGLVTHRDLVHYALFALGDLPYSEKRAFLKETSVTDAMTKDPETIEPDSLIEDAARIMLENKYGCLPVTQGGKVVGILTEADFIKHLLKVREEEREAS